MEKKILKILVNALVNVVFLCIGFYCDPKIFIFGIGVPWALVILGIIVFLIVLFLLLKLFNKIRKKLWKKFINELKKELNIV